MSKRNQLVNNPFISNRNEFLELSPEDYLSKISFLPLQDPFLKNKIFQKNDFVIMGAAGIGKTSLFRSFIWDVNCELIKSNNKLFTDNNVIPTFGIHLSLYEEIQEGFYGEKLSTKEWRGLFYYYFSLYILKVFIQNLKKYSIKYQKNDFLKKEINLKKINLPFLNSCNSLDVLEKSINQYIDDVVDFIISFFDIDEKKKKLRFLTHFFYDQIIESLAQQFNLTSIFQNFVIILDDFSFLQTELVKELILVSLNNRDRFVDLKIISRYSKKMKREIEKFDSRDVILIDLDYFYNSIVNFGKFQKIAREVVCKRLNIQETAKLDDIFEILSEEEEANIYYEHQKKDLILNYMKSVCRDRKNLKEFEELIKSIKNNLIRKKTEIFILQQLKKEGYNFAKAIMYFEEMKKKSIQDRNYSSCALILLANEAELHKMYFGFTDIVKASSNNIHTLLNILKTLFNSKIMLNEKWFFKYDEQDKILKYYSKLYIEKIKFSGSWGIKIHEFFDYLFIRYLKEPIDIFISYPKGRTGIGLPSDTFTMNELFDNEILENAFKERVILVKDIKKKVKGFSRKSRLTLYVNRLYCIEYDLPLNYGGYLNFEFNQLISLLRSPEKLKEMQKSNQSKKQKKLDVFFNGK